jgi:UDP-N-acetylglucosamine 2-epimerase (non-hydrolysing)
MARKFRLVTLLGIRPDYIRMYKVIRHLDHHKGNIEHILVHSGQHYDPELFGVFLKEFNIRQPDIDLGIGLSLQERGESNHAYQVGLLTERVYDMIERVKPDAAMYLGDTNTALSSPTVARCGVPVIHLEAGGRSFDWRMPEEKNRVVIDHVSDALYSYLARYKEQLVAEGIEPFRVTVIGNIIVDPLTEYSPQINESSILKKLGLREKEFILVTLHREENISIKEILQNKLSNIERFGKEKKMPVVLPVMPRTGAATEKFGLAKVIKDWVKTKPLGFFDFLKLEKTARLVVSDSGTVQEETLIVGTPCVIARRSTERPETIWAGATVLEGQEGKDTLYKSMVKAWDMPTDWDRTVLNPMGGSPSDRVYHDLVGKTENGYFEKSRNFDWLKPNKFVRDAYNIHD